MAPWRIGDVDAWLEKCPACDCFWVEKLDQRTLARQRYNQAARQAYDEMSSAEKEDLKQGLATAVSSEYGAPEISPIQRFLAIIGLPVLLQKKGIAIPWLTWSIAAALLLIFLVVDAHDAGSYVVGDSGLWQAFTSIFVHFGWLHLLGNIFFLLAFGDGVEQKLPPWGLALLFVCAGVLATLLQAAVSPAGVSIGGASGAIAALMGACVVLQPQAKVAVTLYFVHVIRVPIIGFGIFQFVYQAFMAGAGSPGVAWTAHLAGMIIGACVGVAVRVLGGKDGEENQHLGHPF